MSYHSILCAALLSVSIINTTKGADSAPGTRRLVRLDPKASNLLVEKNWRAYEKGFAREGGGMVCDNGPAGDASRGASQTIVLNQKVAAPIVAGASSRCENVGGSRNGDYSIYLDLVYMDGDHLWGRTGNFDVGTHDWQRQEVRIMPEKPVKSVSVNLLLRKHGGKAVFKDAMLQQLEVPASAGLLDGLVTLADPVAGKVESGLFVRDVGADGDFVKASAVGPANLGQFEAMGLNLRMQAMDGNITEIQVADSSGKDRALTLVYTMPAPATRHLVDPRRDEPISGSREYRRLDHSGRISRLPIAAVADDRQGRAIGIDMAHPAIFRVGYAGATRELYIAYDLALCREKPSTSVYFYTLQFDAKLGLRSAIDQIYNAKAFREQFENRFKRLGLWMPFHAISKVKGWEDFGFAFKEGNDEVAWDDAHDIITFRYTEPMTWWMTMPKGMPRTFDAALAHAKALAEKNNPQARALFTSGFKDARGQPIIRLRDEPWCDGGVWSMNSLPGIAGESTDFKNKWNPQLKEKLYGAGAKGTLDGEYVDSIEGWVTDDLDFDRTHFAGATTPLTFDPATRQPAIHKGLIVFEYTRALRNDLKPMGKFTMGNGAGSRFCWLVPLVDVNGTETNWNRNGKWSPMSDAELMTIRWLTGAKPYCFLMNTNFDQFGPALVEKYMKRALAYGMFPGFFSPDASRGHYFSRAELYDRDRPLFKKYVPLCRQIAEAGWQPIALARSSDEKVYVERWGKTGATQYLTVFNDSDQSRTIALTLEGLKASTARELIGDRAIQFTGGRAEIRIEAEDVQVLRLE